MLPPCLLFLPPDTTSFSLEYPFLWKVGCYVDEVDKNAFMFGDDNKLTLVSGDQAFTQAMVRI